MDSSKVGLLFFKAIHNPIFYVIQELVNIYLKVSKTYKNTNCAIDLFPHAEVFNTCCFVVSANY